MNRVSFLEGELQIRPTQVDIAKIFEQAPDDEIDFAAVKAQESVNWALEISAAGRTTSCDSVIRSQNIA